MADRKSSPSTLFREPRRWLIASRCVCAIVFAGDACGSAGAETLADALAMAYRSNPTLGAARSDTRAADETLVQAKSELRPTASAQISGGYDYSRLGRPSRAADPFGAASTGTAVDNGDLVVTQPVYTGGRAVADRRLADANIRGAQAALMSAEGDLFLSVVTDYMDVRRYAASLEVWRTSVQELERISTEIEARQRAGELTRTDVAQGQAQLQIAREQAVATEQALEQARADYTALVGQWPGTLAEPPVLPQIPASVDIAYGLAERQNPDLAQSRATERGSLEEIAVARSTGRPTISLRGDANINGHDYPYRLRDQDKELSGSVVLNIPITNGGQIASQIREARERNVGDQLRIEAQQRQVFRDTAEAWNAIVSARRQLDLLSVQQGAAITQLDGMIKEYRAGLRSTFDVLYAQQQLRDIQVSLLETSRDSYIAEATLLRRTGLLNAENLLSNLPLYDPADHLSRVRNTHWLPWEAVVAKIDAIGSGVRTPTLKAALSAAQGASMRAGGIAPGADSPLARAGPTPIGSK